MHGQRYIYQQVPDPHPTGHEPLPTPSHLSQTSLAASRLAVAQFPRCCAPIRRRFARHRHISDEHARSVGSQLVSSRTITQPCSFQEMTRLKVHFGSGESLESSGCRIRGRMDVYSAENANTPRFPRAGLRSIAHLAVSHAFKALTVFLPRNLDTYLRRVLILPNVLNVQAFIRVAFTVLSAICARRNLGQIPRYPASHPKGSQRR